MSTQLQAAVHGESFVRLTSETRNLLRQLPAHSEVLESLDKELDSFERRGFLTLAFVGEYSAGKSTIISALTGRKDIKISADVATDRATAYPWNGIQIVDTPGLWTDNPQHDKTTLDAIQSSDLLVFCLTYSLFDAVTLPNFRKLAYEENYQQKMLLLINKMSAEAGSDEQKIESYSASLGEALQPQDVRAFPTYYIDAKDYIEGIDAGAADLVEMSRMATFIDGVNQFVAAKGAIARLDTPIRIVMGHLDAASDKVLRDETEDDSYTEILGRLARIVDKSRKALRVQVADSLQKLRSAIGALGRELAAQIDEEHDPTPDVQAAQAKVQTLCEQAELEIQELIETAAQTLQQGIEREQEAPLFTEYLKRIETPTHTSDLKLSRSMADINIRISQVKNLSNALGNLVKSGLSDTASKAGARLTSTGAAGSGLHKGILEGGKLVGFKFKPWQAVNLAKNMAQAVAIASLVIQVVSIFSEVANEAQKHENSLKLNEAKRDLVNEFQNAASEAAQQFEAALRESEAALYGEMDDLVAIARQEHERSVAGSNSTIRSIITLRQQYGDLLKALQVGGHAQ